ncbi:hypothetical protein SAMN03080594_103152 [Arenibacter palladensis]|uniref:Uncharacterized protein n=2 Tax=Arenibacter TaxID=178469 RepID=A0A1X7IQY0_9FLAO|nr:MULTISPECIES: hypothetical protein [Arenibacter]MDO6602455.1 hypothetical protein [Arenibacter palladensis]MDX1285211.1 hypothetical protein [Draconibacterium sp.]SHF26950.1 hypothetical protein SAMN03080594_103152 [Arenibacter palladensis]SMG17374.1 hypothetical protein SAMN03080602_00975 [Arenibacter troitsensis]
MKRKLKVLEFDKKQKLVDYVNTNSDKLDVLTITTSQEAISFKHFLWYYEN